MSLNWETTSDENTDLERIQHRLHQQPITLGLLHARAIVTVLIWRNLMSYSSSFNQSTGSWELL